MATTASYDPATSAKLDVAHVVGLPIPRVDGLAKVTGAARYTYEILPAGRAACGFIVQAEIACGRIADIDSSVAERVPGVLLVMTHRNAPAQAPWGPPVAESRMTRARPVLGDERVRFRGEAVALVVAESFETARAAAALVTVRYEPEHAALDLDRNLQTAYRPAKVGPGLDADTALGDFAGAFVAASSRIDVSYECGYQHHNPMEPHAALAQWDGDRLTVQASQQQIASVRRSLATTLRMPEEKVRVISRFVGGGFGSKIPMNAEVVLAALAAKLLRRPVKVTQTRQQMFTNTGHRPAFRQRVRLGADTQGRLAAIGHEVWGQTARFDEFAEQTAAFTRSLYAAPNRLTAHRLVPLDLQHGETMRAPGEAPGMLAFECAMDELAVELGIDPVELRLRNEPALDPERQIPFSSRKLAECMLEGARRFGWAGRPRTPQSRRQGRAWVGYGMAAGIRPNKIGNSAARVFLRADGGATARLDMTDIGTGSYTILTQIVCEVLGLPVGAVAVELGDSAFPKTTGSGGSLGAGSAGSALYNACLALRSAVIRAAASNPLSPLHGADAGSVELRNGEATNGRVAETLAQIAARAAPGSIEAEGSVAPGDTYSRYSQHSFAAYFAEVHVDMDTCEARVHRMLGAFDVGRVLNARTARSQLIGGMAWGVSAALHEEGVVDGRFGHVVNHDLVGYHVPVHADIPDLEVVLLDGNDPNSNPIGSKGLGELGICGSGAAIANAIYNATGARVRSFPITLDKVLPLVPKV